MNNFHRDVVNFLNEAILREKADLLNIYVERENELMAVAGFDLRTLIDKLKAGYTIEPPKEDDSTPHEEFLEERCARFKDLIQFLSFYIDPRTPMVTRFEEMVANGRLTPNDARYLSGLPELDQTTKPPLGVMPRDIWNRKRQKELADAMQRYLEAGKSIPREWVDEYNELNDGEG